MTENITFPQLPWRAVNMQIKIMSWVIIRFLSKMINLEYPRDYLGFFLQFTHVSFLFIFLFLVWSDLLYPGRKV